MAKWFFIILWAAMPLSGCEDDGFCSMISHHEFEIPVLLEPDRAKFNIGDTIMITSVFEDVVYERSFDTVFQLEQWEFFPTIAISRLDTFPSANEIVYARDAFNFEVINTNVEDFHFTSAGLKGEYDYSNNTYSLELMLVALEAGAFLINVTSGVVLDLAHQPFEGGCPGVRSEVAMIMNGGGDNNIHLLEESPHPHFNTTILSRTEELFTDRAGYAFVVE